MTQRHPIADGRFYPGTPKDCKHSAIGLFESVALPPDLPARCFGGLVPHAGWSFSGRLAAMTLKALLGDCEGTPDSDGQNKTVVLFGADHTGVVQMGEVFDTGCWETPVGNIAIDESLGAGLLNSTTCSGLLRSNPAAHAQEHSLEVQLPLIATLAPGTKILPIAVPPNGSAANIGRTVGATRKEYKHARNVVIVGSTDLTHHGGHFGYFSGSGRSECRGLQSEVFARKNDRRILDLIEAMDCDAIVPEATRNHNACGAGAIAATMGAVGQLGATKAKILGYTNSYEIMHGNSESADDATVGYASVVFA